MRLRWIPLTLAFALPLAACTSEKPTAMPDAAPSASLGGQLIPRYDCDDLLADPRLQGMRLVEAESAGTGLGSLLCSYAPSDMKTASASTVAPVAGKRVTLNTVSGDVTITDVVYTSPPIDPGDAGPTAPRPN